MTITAAIADPEKAKKEKNDGAETRKNTQSMVHPTGNRKVLKGDKGSLVVKEIKNMLKFIDSAQRHHRSETGGLYQYRSIGSST